MRRVGFATLTTLMLFAGCLAAPEDIESASASLDSPLIDSLGAYESPLTFAGDAIVLRTNASPSGGTAAFWWEIPEGVILGDDEDDTWIEFLAAPVLLEEHRAPLERWMLMAFLADEGALALNSLAFGAPFTLSADGVLAGGSEEVERSLDPFLFGAGGKLRPGGRIGFVVSGVAAEDVEMALVLLPLQEEWDDEDLPEDTEEFLAYIEDHSRVALPVSGVGGAHQLAFHYQGGASFARHSVTSGPVEQQGSSTDALVASRRGLTVSTLFDSGGYAIAAAGYDSATAAGSWSAIADAHGAVSEGGGTMATTLGAGVAGWPYVVAMGEGDAPSQTSLMLDSVSALSDDLYILQLDLDTTLTDLFGLPALRIDDMTGEGEAARDGRDLTMTLGGVHVRGVGLG